jgi:methyl-accepting chemotaxis protein
MKRLIWMLPLLAIVMGAVTSFLFYRSTEQLLTGLGTVDSPSLNQTQSLIFDLNTVTDGFKSAVVTADKATLDATLEKVATFRQHVKDYASVPGQTEAASQISKGFEAYIQACTKVTAILLDGQAGDPGEAAAAMQASLTTLQRALTARKTAAQQALDAHIAKAQSLAQRGFMFNVATSLLTLALAVGVSRWSVRHLMKQLGGAPEDATRIVQRLASGNLSEPVQLSEGTPGSLLHAMQGMQTQLASVIGGVRQAVQQVHQAADGISQGNETLTESCARQTASLQASASSIEALNISVRDNAQSAEQARAVASQANQNADAGSRAVADAVSTMGEISERARKIVEITALIDGIAFQTNILALNAAVEAARAGEQGRGFSVVAGEVRTLAQRAGSAAKDIKALIDDSAQRIEVGAHHVNAAGAAMEDLVASVKQVSEHIANIAAASRLQQAGIDQVNSAVADLDASTQQNHQVVEQAVLAAQALQSVARQLGDAVGQFRLNDAALGIARRLPEPAQQALPSALPPSLQLS